MGNSFFETSIIDAIYDILATINGSSPFGNDLSAADSRQYGEPVVEPPSTKAAIYLTNASIRTDAADAAQGAYHRYATLGFAAFVKCSEDTPNSRFSAGCTLIDDLVRALEGTSAPGQRTLGGIDILDIAINNVDYSQLLQAEAPYRRVEFDLEIEWFTRSGSGL